MKKILIIGSSGFIGSSLNDYFGKKKNYKLINISRTQNNNIINLKKLPKANYLIYCIKSTNLKKTIKYFEHFKKLLVEKSTMKIVFFSSGAVYGPSTKKNKFKENQKISIKKINTFVGYKKKYAKEKIILENKFKEIANKGFKVSIVRGFTFYGKHILRYNYLISQILRAVKEKSKLVIKNKNTYRSFMYADDMCKCLIKILEKSTSKCPIYNLGSSHEIDINYLISFLNKKYKSKIQIENRKSAIDYYIPSTHKILKILKIKKLISLERGIKLILS